MLIILAMCGICLSVTQASGHAADGPEPRSNQGAATRPESPVANRNLRSGRETAPCTSLERAVAKAETPLEKIESHLAAARCLLVRQCAPHLSRELSGSPSAGKALVAIAERSRTLLASATEAMGILPDDFDDGARQAFEDRIDMLRAFAKMFAVLGQEGDVEAVRRKLTDACIGLATYVDDANAGVVESAKLWQGAAYRRAGRPNRALQLLVPALAPSTSSRVDFLTRIERCRALADSGSYVAALSLALKLADATEAWFEDDDQAVRKKAADTLRWVRADILQRWAAALRNQGKDARANAAEAEAKTILGKRPFPPPAEQWLSLTETIAGLPDWPPINLAGRKR